MPYPSGHFDLVTAFSVFTHLGANWADWLLEIRRVLAAGGWFVVTFLDESCSMVLSSVPYAADEVAMTVFGFAEPGMPYVNVLHSPWWLREHWGRAFEFERLIPGGTSDPGGPLIPGVQGVAVLRPGTATLTPDDLWLEAPGERRYAAARRHQLEVLRAEGERLKAFVAQSADERSSRRRMSGRWRRRA